MGSDQRKLVLALPHCANALRWDQRGGQSWGGVRRMVQVRTRQAFSACLFSFSKGRVPSFHAESAAWETPPCAAASSSFSCCFRAKALQRRRSTGAARTARAPVNKRAPSRATSMGAEPIAIGAGRTACRQPSKDECSNSDSCRNTSLNGPSRRASPVVRALTVRHPAS
jgi:hypothetical protein